MFYSCRKYCDPLLITRETRWYSRSGFEAAKTLKRKMRGMGEGQTSESKDLMMIKYPLDKLGK